MQSREKILKVFPLFVILYNLLLNQHSLCGLFFCHQSPLYLLLFNKGQSIQFNLFSFFCSFLFCLMLLQSENLLFQLYCFSDLLLSTIMSYSFPCSLQSVLVRINQKANQNQLRSSTHTFLSSLKIQKEIQFQMTSLMLLMLPKSIDFDRMLKHLDDVRISQPVSLILLFPVLLTLLYLILNTLTIQSLFHKEIPLFSHNMKQSAQVMK